MCHPRLLPIAKSQGFSWFGAKKLVGGALKDGEVKKSGVNCKPVGSGPKILPLVDSISHHAKLGCARRFYGISNRQSTILKFFIVLAILNDTFSS